MNRSILFRRGLIWTAGALGGLFTLAAGLALAMEAGYFRGPLIRFIAFQIALDTTREHVLLFLIFASCRFPPSLSLSRLVPGSFPLAFPPSIFISRPCSRVFQDG